MLSLRKIGVGGEDVETCSFLARGKELLFLYQKVPKIVLVIRTGTTHMDILSVAVLRRCDLSIRYNVTLGKTRPKQLVSQLARPMYPRKRHKLANSSVHVTVSTICRISFMCAQTLIETE